jgi:pseudouridine synthase
MGRERLDKILASQNIATRKDAGALIRRGAVSVNGEPAAKADFKADPELDEIAVNGRILNVKKNVYYMMNKPAGVLSAARDTHARTVVDLLPPEMQRRGLFPAGRLDRDTEGLLLITDDGAFAHRMLAPKSHVFKRYEAVLESPVAPEDAARFENGLVLEDMTCLPAGLRVLEAGANPRVLVRIREGKFHQVKRMFLAIGNRVLQLRRVQIGALRLDPALTPGETRELTPDELEAVFRPDGNLDEFN